MSPRPLAVVAAGFMLLLLLAGGFVTSSGSGDTIPTWPSTNGGIAPHHGSVGAWIEQNHRYLAGFVGLLIGVLMIWVRKTEERPWVRRWAYVAFGAVVLQALIGGYRIFEGAKSASAIVHAIIGQVTFGVLVALTLFLSRSWGKDSEDEGMSQARTLGFLSVGFALAQLMTGAIVRHTGAGVLVHVGGALLVILHASLFASRLVTTRLKGGAHLLLLLLGVQVILGLGSWTATSGGAVRSLEISAGKLIVVTVHQTVGALVLATLIVLALKCWSASRRAVESAAPKAAGV